MSAYRESTAPLSELVDIEKQMREKWLALVIEESKR
jgi:hypothetical protein